MQIRLNPSDHAVRGLITATDAYGRIIWRGAAQDLGQARGFAVLHVHSADVGPIKIACQRKNIDVRVLT
jgi:hypothetical protein